MHLLTSRQTLIKCYLQQLFAAVVAFSLIGCDIGRIAMRGNLPDPDRVADLKPGAASKGQVLSQLGSPSSVNSFGNETWYYISETTEVVAFLKPKVRERQILIVEFNNKGKLAQIVSVGLDEGRELKHVERVTPTFGEELTVLDQILGNFRRFSGTREINSEK